MEENEMGRECGMYGEKENYTQIFCWQTLRKETTGRTYG
jgi:hypothetical protein